MCAAAVLFALLAFLLSALAVYRALVSARDAERWRNLRDHPSTRGGLPPEDSPEWGQR
jgi:type II secretory pathway component PulK